MDMLIVCYVKYKMNGDEEGLKGNTDLQNLMNTLLGKEIDTGILLGLFADYYNRSVEALSAVLNFKVIQCTNKAGSMYKGIVSFEDESLTVNLDCAYDGCKPTYTVTNVC